MRVVLQRATAAQVVVDTETVGAIGPGLVLLAAFVDTDTDEVLTWMARKCVDLRIFPDDQGKMNRSLADTGGDILVVSQFTLYGDCRKGRRPSFVQSAAPATAEALYDRFVAAVGAVAPGSVATGRFGADMKLQLTNDGPVTLILDRDASA